MAPTAQPQLRPALRWGACAAIGAIGAALVFLGAHRALIDDSYITLDYARTLAQHGQWALEPGHQANTATSPLNVLLLAGLIVLTGAPVVSVGILLAITVIVISVALSVISTRLGHSQWPAVTAVILLVTNPLLISTIGLETYLGIALIAVLGAAVVTRRTVAIGVVCGLLVLTRADLAAFAVAALIAVTGRSPAHTRWRDLVQVLGIGGVVALPWFAASWWWLGSAIPDTLLFKTSETWPNNSFATGLWNYEIGFPVATVLSVLPAVIGVLVLAAWRVVARHQRSTEAGVLVVVWGLGAILHIMVYLLLRPPPYHWYYGPSIAAFTMLAVMGLAGPSRRVHWFGCTVGALVIAASVVFLVSRPWQVMPISSNWASASEYAALAARVPSGVTVETFGEVGTVAYFCDCTVIDRFSDRAQVAELLRAKRAAAGPVVRTLLDLNYYRLKTDPPIHASYKFVFAEDPTGISVTSWLPYRGRMVVRPAD
ncbi:MAG: hypothetical protein JOZ09_02090 [Pseudonocardiales bacterium]|nr:hypothetical protein [Pseudonocardiales bacterium]